MSSIHQHRTYVTSRPLGYTGPVATDPRRQEPRAHGGVRYVSVCSCGATREHLVNQRWTEYGPWRETQVISEGAYVGTSDDVAGTYYVDRADADTWDRRGRGYGSKRAAAQAILEGSA